MNTILLTNFVLNLFSLTGPISPSRISLTFLSERSIPFGWLQTGDKQALGGISALDRDPCTGEFVMVSDHPNVLWRANVTVDPTNHSLSFKIGHAIMLRNFSRPLGNALDIEGLAFSHPNDCSSASARMLLSTERDEHGHQSRVLRFLADGRWAGPGTGIDTPSFYAGPLGDHINFGFESLTVSPDGHRLYVANERPLVRDSHNIGSGGRLLLRVTQLNISSGAATRSVAYPLDDLAVAGARDWGTGLSELVALDNQGTLLAVERSYSPTVGRNAVRLYTFSMRDGSDLLVDPTCSESALNALCMPVHKQLLFDVGTSAAQLKNYEGACLGPRLSGGDLSILLVNDNNYNSKQGATNFALFAVHAEGMPIAKASLVANIQKAREANYNGVQTDDDTVMQNDSGTLFQFASLMCAVGIVWLGIILVVMSRFQRRINTMPTATDNNDTQAMIQHTDFDDSSTNTFGNIEERAMLMAGVA